jgi:hypothetical protein
VSINETHSSRLASNAQLYPGAQLVIRVVALHFVGSESRHMALDDAHGLTSQTLGGRRIGLIPFAAHVEFTPPIFGTQKLDAR